MEVTLKIILDERTKKVDGSYPVKLRAIWNRKPKYFPTKYALTKEEFEDVFSKKPSKAAKEVYLDLSKLLGKATAIVDDMKYFSFEAFKSKLLDDAFQSTDAFKYYDAYIATLKHDDRVGTADNYRLSMKSIKGFLDARRKASTYLPFEEITASWLKDYEKYMLALEKSPSTVGIYLRPLRALFNMAIEDGNVTKEQYPFGKRRYQIPARRKVKKALDKGALKIIFEADLTDNPTYQKARDFWFFSYSCNGINLKDVAELRWENIEQDRIVFVRAKTSLTTKSNQKELVAYRSVFMNQVIERHGTTRSKHGYVFDILEEGLSTEERRRVVRNFTRYVNQHIKSLAESLGITGDISYIWARHSFTTNAIRGGATMEEIQDRLGHQNILTTQNYFAGFDDESRKRIADSVMDFSDH